MPWTAEQYSQAKELVGTLDDPKRKAALERGIMNFEQSTANRIGGDPEAAGVSEATGAKLRGKASMQRGLNPQVSPFNIGTAPTGLAALESNPSFTEDRPEEPLETGPHLARTPGGGHSVETRPTRAGRVQKMTPLTTVGDFKTTESVADTTGLPSATGTKALYRPPEFIPPGANFATSMKARVEFEPSVDQFRADLGQRIGPAVMALDENSPQFKEYSDQVWAQKYDTASKAGIPITRKQYMNKDSWQAQVANVATSFRDRAETGLTGIASGLSLGAGPEMIASSMNQTNDLREQQKRNPGENVVGNIVGAASPSSAISRLLAPLRGAAPGAGLGARMGAAATKGSIGGAIEGGSGALNRKSADLVNDKRAGLAGPDSLGEFAEEVLPEVGEGALIGGALGGAFSAAGEGIGSLAGSGVKYLREMAHRGDLPAAERAGVKTDLLRGVKATPSIEANIKGAASIPGASRETPMELAADKVKVELANEGAQHSQDVVRLVQRQNENYYASKEGQAKVPLKQTVTKLGELISRAQDDMGDDLPMMNSAPFQKVLHQAFTPTIMDEAGARVEVSLNGGWKMDMEKAKKLGLMERAVELQPTPASARADLPTAADGIPRPGSADLPTAAEGLARKTPGPMSPPTPPAAPGPKVLVMVPKKLNAEQFDNVIRGFDEAADAAAGGLASRAKPKMYSELMDAARRDRGNFRPNSVTGFQSVTLPSGEKVSGWGALKFKQAERLGGKEELLNRAKLPEKPKPGGWDALMPDEKEAFEAFLRKSGQNSLGSEKAIQQLALQGRVGPAYNDIAGTRATLSLKEGGETPLKGANTSFLRTVGGELLPGHSLRMDPLLRKLALSSENGAQREGLRKSLGLSEAYQEPSIPGQFSFGLRGGGLGVRAGAAQLPSKKRKARAYK